MPAKSEIQIDGRTFNRCHISRQQWKECLTPCTFCHSIVQGACDPKHPFCNNEHECYVALDNIYGEPVNEE